MSQQIELFPSMSFIDLTIGMTAISTRTKEKSERKRRKAITFHFATAFQKSQSI